MPFRRGRTLKKIYYPILRSLSNPEQADSFYSILESVIRETKKRDELFILGDFNAKVGSAPPGTSGAVGCFSKHTVSNANGERLLDFCNSNKLILTNTLFKYRMHHRATWFSDGLCHADGKQVRNMIDYAIICKSAWLSIKDAKFYAGFSTMSDHHPVIIDVSPSFKRITKLSNSSEPCFVRYNSPTPQSSEDFRRMISETLPIFPLSVSSNEDMDNLWSNLVSSLHTAAEKTFGIVRRGRSKCSSNPEVTVLSKQQRDLHVRVCAEPNEARRNEIKKKRSAILHQIRTILREEGDRFCNLAEQS